MNFEIIDKKILNELNIVQDNIKEVYAYKNNNKLIGLIIIKNNKDNMLYFTIFDEYRGLGYGKQMVNEALKLLKEIGNTELNFILDRKNIKAIKIITSLGGIHLSNIGSLSKYRIYL